MNWWRKSLACLFWSENVPVNVLTDENRYVCVCVCVCVHAQADTWVQLVGNIPFCDWKTWQVATCWNSSGRLTSCNNENLVETDVLTFCWFPSCFSTFFYNRKLIRTTHSFLSLLIWFVDLYCSQPPGGDQEDVASIVLRCNVIHLVSMFCFNPMEAKKRSRKKRSNILKITLIYDYTSSVRENNCEKVYD